MPSGYANPAGTDLDDVFDAYVQGDKAIATGYYTSDGNDLNQRYAPLIFGTKAADVGYSDNSGTDVSNRFAAKGTAQYSLAFHGKSYYTGREALTNQQGNISAIVTFGLSPDGSWSIGADTGSPVTGTWLPAGRAASEYSVQLVASGMSRAVFGTTAPSYVSCSVAQSCSVTATVRAASVDQIDETVTVTVHLRDSAGVVSTSTFNARVFAHGWV
ncbi:MAG TPA: hypothetical protein VM687_02265 [Stenotrophomonas sp.]|nr:hypothetical protein [Stenotrophomonas sp.]